MSRDEIADEQALKAKGKTAPRVTPEMIGAMIADEQYEVFFGVLTVCVLQLTNGFTVVGESACVSPENFDAELGQHIARRNAREKIWPLEGYRLRCELDELEQDRLHQDFHPATYRPEPIAPEGDE